MANKRGTGVAQDSPLPPICGILEIPPAEGVSKDVGIMIHLFVFLLLSPLAWSSLSYVSIF